ncbi:MAG: hypothetical protein COA49_10050 [Bacteroidetes bacterium]|nr:MAG: hypothetical protein COA49_10050 [Bacteroidota bacterium]
MLSKTKLVLVSFIILLALNSCGDREALSWESEIFLPLIDDNITWSSLVPDSILVVGEGGEPARLVYNGPLDIFSQSTLTSLPDTTLDNVFSMGNDLPIAIPVPEDFPFMDITNDMTITNLGGGSDTYLRELVLSGGTMTFTVESTVSGILNMNYSLPSVTVNGVVVGIDLEVPASLGGVNGQATSSIDLAGAVFDLTGADGTSNNIIQSAFTAINSPLNSEVFYITNLDSLSISIELHDMDIQQAKGYFGNVDLEYGTQVSLIDTVPIPNPVLNLEGAVAKLRIDNLIGADIRMVFDTLLVDGSPVSHPSLYGAHDIPRAQWIEGNLIDHTVLEIDLGESGSNIFDLMETLPQLLRIAGSVELNPFGDISFGNDFIDIDYISEVELEIEIPFHMGVDGVILEESYTIDPMDFPNFDGMLLVDFTSTFPVEVIADIKYVVNDSIGTVVSIDGVIEAGMSFPETPAYSLVEIPINQAIIEPGGEIFLVLTVRTDGAQIFTGYENIRVQVRIEGTQLIEVQ